MSDEEEDILWGVAVLGAAYFLVVKPILGEFGLSPTQQAAVDQGNNTPPDENPFSPLYQPFIDNYGATDLNAAMKNLKVEYDILTSDSPIDPNDINPLETAKKAETIYGAFGFFGFKNYDLVAQVFATVNDKIEVATIAAYLQVNYGISLWNYLKDGRWYNITGVPKDELVTIVNLVNGLPVSKT